MNEKTLFVCFILLMVVGGIAVFWMGERWARRKHAEDAVELQRCMSAPRPDAPTSQINQPDPATGVTKGGSNV